MVDSKIFMDSIISGANNIYKNRIHINELNVFPVPDGDTGTNMSMTILEVARKFETLVSDNIIIGDVASILSSVSLRSARGNSGVILSLIFKGFKDAFAGLKRAGVEDFVKALEFGTNYAYSAVSKPMEGTILTIIRCAYEEGYKLLKETNILERLGDFWSKVCDGARKALFSTPDFLPILKKAGVVDAGGKGLCLIFEGMLSVFSNGIIIEKDTKEKIYIKKYDEFKNLTSKFDEKVNFTYCTEFIIEKNIRNCVNISKFKSKLEKIGDSLVVLEDEEVIKTHVHTNSPNKALEIALSVGNLLNIEINNMEEQRKKKLELASAKKNKEIASFSRFEKVKPIKNLGVLAVACGNGLINAFKNLGADQVVEGGQTLNPNAGEIALASQSIPAKVVFILANNQNIVLSAQQAQKLVKDRELVVLPAKTLPQGLSALVVFDESFSKEKNIELMNKAIKSVKTGQVTYAERDCEFNNLKIKKGDIIALYEGKLVLSGNIVMDVTFKLISLMLTKNNEFVTLIYGNNISVSDLDMIKEKVLARYSGIQIQDFCSDSEIYYFTISVE